MNKPLIYFLDTLSGSTLIAGIISGQTLFWVIGGIASILAAINHGQQILERRKKKKQ